MKKFAFHASLYDKVSSKSDKSFDFEILNGNLKKNLKYRFFEDIYADRSVTFIFLRIG